MYIVIFITASSKKEAAKIAQQLISNKLAACANIIAGLHSIFRWKDKVEQAREALLVVKTRKEKFAKIVKLVKSMHSYTTPEIIAIPVTCGFKPYLNWINDSLR